MNYEESEVELVIVDGIFGTGLAREVGEPEKWIIQLINASEKSVLAVDIPSDLDAASGNVPGVCIKATKTVTFARPKTGFLGNEKYTGEIISGYLHPKNSFEQFIPPP